MARFRRRSGAAPPAAPHDADPVTAQPRPFTDSALAGYRLLRRLAAGDRADVYLAAVERTGADVARGEPASAHEPLVVMRVYGPGTDDGVIATEIEAMQHDGSGPTPALLDVATLADGRACLVVERVGGPSLGSLLADGDLLPGQAVTALAPVVVAARTLADLGLVHTRFAATDVLIDDTGRPRLIGLGALARLDAAVATSDRVGLLRGGHAALLRLIEEVVGSTRDPSAFAEVVALARSSLDARPFVRAEVEIEQALFAAATPMPVPGVPTDARPRGVPSRLAPIERFPDDPTREVVDDARDRDGRRSGWTRLAELAQLPGEVADDLATSLDRDPRAVLARRAAGWARRRRGALLTGGLVGAGALVALLTAVPPSAADVRAEPGTEAIAMEAQTEAAPAAESLATSAPPSPSTEEPMVVPGDDPIAAASALLEIRATCLASADLDCLGAVEQPGSPIEARDRAAIDAGEGTADPDADLDAITLVADLGDAVVLSVPSAGGEREPASLLMIRSEAGWRLREWFD